ncbi:hypothetical protein MOF05_20635 [Bacillus haynesii]|uniref:Uncharacterized protein n=1 Tax=Bacillus haynesii TaxID=1925021 RepID=A0AA90J4Q3_9BACI|nr:hypothetical protein [Bacillus haynesii]MCY7793512.1 hypothetical protein [Bacillus haynesii]MCY7850202.1 hypothetical protein [Bacillus haynesii]MCY8000993.1 hypothetical protein [Bacillus haynesii]MCY8013223.1 hypothetical protein [Bacillus haynesii]
MIATGFSLADGSYGNETVQGVIALQKKAGIGWNLRTGYRKSIGSIKEKVIIKQQKVILPAAFWQL